MSTTNSSLAHSAQRPARSTPVTTPAPKQQGTPAESEAPCSSLLTGKNAATTCAGIRNNGERCRGRLSAGQEYCSFHRTDLRETIADGRIIGGRRGKYVVRPFEEQTGARLALRLDSRGGIQGSVDHVLRMLLFGAITPQYANAATRLIATAARNLDHTNRDTEDHSLDQYLASISNHFMIQQLMHAPAPKRLVTGEHPPAIETPTAPDLRKAAHQ